MKFLIALAIAGGLGFYLMTSSHQDDRSEPPAPPTVNYFGVPLPENDMRRSNTPLAQKRACSWGVPGHDMYRGNIDEALQAMRLNAVTYDALRTKIFLGMYDDTAVINRYGIFVRGTGAAHPPYFRSMAFGRTMCFGTFVNFEEHVYEEARIYRARRATGELLEIIVPDVCGNIAELTPAVPIPEQPRSWPDNKSVQNWVNKYGTVSPRPGGGYADTKKTNTVPEPGTLALLASPLALLVAFRRR